MKRIFSTLIILLSFPCLVHAADTIVWSVNDEGQNWIELKAVITADGSGNVASPTETSTVPAAIWDVAKVLSRVIAVPDAGDTAPTDEYDLLLYKSSTISVDMLGGLANGTWCDGTNATMDFPVTATNGGPIYVTDLPVASGSGFGADNACTFYLLLVDVNSVKVSR